MKSGVVTVRCQCQILVAEDDLTKIANMRQMKYELANVMTARGGSRDEWVEFFESLGNHGERLGRQVEETVKQLIDRWGIS